MGAIGAVEEAHGAATAALVLLEHATNAADDEGRHESAYDLRELYEDMDDLTNRIGQQREALRA